MIRVIIEYKDGTTRQFLPRDWRQIMRLYAAPTMKQTTVFAITPRDFSEYQKKITNENLDFMRVSR
jgi:hypothetical protein